MSHTRLFGHACPMTASRASATVLSSERRPKDRRSATAETPVDVEEVLRRLGVTRNGLSSAEAAARIAVDGPNAVLTRRVSALAVLGRQLRSAILVLLIVAAALSFFVGDSGQAIVIGVIVVASIGLSFVNEYRAEKTAFALHDQLRHQATVLRDGRYVRTDVTQLVVGDVVHLTVGEAVPADVALFSTNGLACDESVLTGESSAVVKCTASGATSAERGVASMGTIVVAGNGTGVVCATGLSTEFGRVAEGLGTQAPETAFQIGLRRFSYLLLGVAVALTVCILAINLALRRPPLESVLFALAIAVGITPQLLPAVVSTSLAAGSRRLAAMKILVKRLVCIEDLGDIDILVTDKTGTLTDGRLAFLAAVDTTGTPDASVLRAGLLAADVDVARGGGAANDLDAALVRAVDAAALTDGVQRLAVLPFDYARRAASVLVADRGDRLLIVKGAPEQLLSRCVMVPAVAHTTLDELFAAGRRVVAVASRPAGDLDAITPGDEATLTLLGFLSFADEPKPGAAEALSRLAALGIDVKVATGDNPTVAQNVCERLGLPVAGVVTGEQLEGLGPARYAKALQENTIFARVSPSQKAALIGAAHGTGRSVGFLGDGVNDALALHAADVGISVDSAVDTAKDAADVVLLEKDLGVLAEGIAQGRRIFANTIKYVLMGTSSNFGNMFSAAAASAFLPFLPMLPSQILLNNLLYDSSQLAISSDRVDDEQLRAPSHWDLAFIRRFMMTFGLISSLFDFATFGLLLWVFHTGPAEFRTGWFVESLATQTLVIFAIRTHRTPFFRSRPSGLLTASALGVVLVGVALTMSAVAPHLGFTPLPWSFYAALAGLAVLYVTLAEVAKTAYYRRALGHRAPRPSTRSRHHHIRRRARAFSYPSDRRITHRVREGT